MEEQSTLSGRSVLLEFEPRHDAAERLADAYRRLLPPPQEVRPRICPVPHPAARSSDERLAREAAS